MNDTSFTLRANWRLLLTKIKFLSAEVVTACIHRLSKEICYFSKD